MPTTDEEARAEAERRWPLEPGVSRGALTREAKRRAFTDGVEWERNRPISDDPKLIQMIADLVDPDDCWFDHNGGCQAHGYLWLEPGELCPQAEAKQWLAARGTKQ